jgi:hypothetical protein
MSINWVGAKSVKKKPNGTEPQNGSWCCCPKKGLCPGEYSHLPSKMTKRAALSDWKVKKVEPPTVFRTFRIDLLSTDEETSAGVIRALEECSYKHTSLYWSPRPVPDKVGERKRPYNNIQKTTWHICRPWRKTIIIFLSDLDPPCRGREAKPWSVRVLL